MTNDYPITIPELIALWRAHAALNDKHNMISGIGETYRQCALELEEANKHPSTLLCPTPDVTGLIPIVLYFANDADADEFCAAMHECKPNLISKRLE